MHPYLICLPSLFIPRRAPADENPVRSDPRRGNAALCPYSPSAVVNSSRSPSYHRAIISSYPYPHPQPFLSYARFQPSHSTIYQFLTHILTPPIPLQTGTNTHTAVNALANTAPPSKLCSTIFLCRSLRLASLTLTLRSKIISFFNILTTAHLGLSSSLSSSPNRSHGSGCRRENSSRKKQLPRSPDSTSPAPSHHSGHAANASQRLCTPRSG